MTSSRRIVKRKATTVVHAVRSCIAPGQERKLLKLIQPAETDDEETKCLDQSELVQLIIKLFKNHQMHIQKDNYFLWYPENIPKKNYRTWFLDIQPTILTELDCTPEYGEGKDL